VWDVRRGGLVALKGTEENVKETGPSLSCDSKKTWFFGWETRISLKKMHSMKGETFCVWGDRVSGSPQKDTSRKIVDSGLAKNVGERGHVKIGYWNGYRQSKTCALGSNRLERTIVVVEKRLKGRGCKR